MLITTAMIVAHTGSAPGKAESVHRTPMASVAPTGAEKTALKMVASSADASRTSPVLRRTKSRPPPDSGVTSGVTATPNLLAGRRSHPYRLTLDMRHVTRR